MCLLNHNCTYNPDRYWSEGGHNFSFYPKCHIHTEKKMERWGVWVVDDYDKVFKSQEDAYNFDVEENPEYHGCKDWSMGREAEAIWECDYEDLGPGQKEYVLYNEQLWG